MWTCSVNVHVHHHVHVPDTASCTSEDECKW
jgi:hypothetical protein